MKRLNPATNQLFKHGDIREDGYRFYRYTNVLKLNGTFKEIWLHPDSHSKARADVAGRQAKTYVRKTSRLPKGWARKLRDPLKIARCKYLWQQLFNAAPQDKEFYDREWLIENCKYEDVRALMMPYTYGH